MTVCQDKGYKVGDKFRVLEAHCGFKEGQIVTLNMDDGSSCPLFKGDNTEYRLADKFQSEGAFLALKHLQKITEQEEVVMSTKFKVGDKVTVTRRASDGFERSSRGKTGTVELVDKTSLPVLVRFEDDSRDWGTHEELSLFKEPVPEATTIKEKLEAIDKLTAEIRAMLY